MRGRRVEHGKRRLHPITQLGKATHHKHRSYHERGSVKVASWVREQGYFSGGTTTTRRGAGVREGLLWLKGARTGPPTLDETAPHNTAKNSGTKVAARPLLNTNHVARSAIYLSSETTTYITTRTRDTATATTAVNVLGWPLTTTIPCTPYQTKKS